MRLSLIVSSLAALTVAAPQQQRRQTDPANPVLGALGGILGVNQTFDYVVVGAGNAGKDRSKYSDCYS